jgi:quinolinate synthase
VSNAVHRAPETTQAAASPLVTVPPLHTGADDAVGVDAEILHLDDAALVAGIGQLRRERNAVVLAHNYQLPAIQDLADFVGDSLQLAQQAATTSADVIVFCGVRFMAETAAIISPAKTVLIPDPEAGCSLAQSVTAADVRAWRDEHPGAVAVAYVNTDAEVKAEVDYCCTSANAVDIVAAIPSDREILFLPDQHLGRYVEHRTGRPMHLWPGECHVHAAIGLDDVNDVVARHPDADLLLHPECGCVSEDLWRLAEHGARSDRTFVLSTGGMVRHATSCQAAVDLVGTEVGMLHRLRQANPTTDFVPVRDDAVCSYMKTITLPKLYRALRDLVYEVRVPEAVATRACASIERMLAIV